MVIPYTPKGHRLFNMKVKDLMASVVCSVFAAGEEPTYSGVPMSTIVEKGYGVGDVISLLWFKRSLPRYCTKFIEVII